MTPPTRSLPRPFTYHWGSGQITEEASHSSQYYEAAIQFLQYDDHEHAGEWAIRFCFYSPNGRFQRSPLVVGKDEIAGLRSALKRTPKIRKLLKKLVEA
jgi:hypothetical protein